MFDAPMIVGETHWWPLFQEAGMAVAVLGADFTYLRVNDAYAAAAARSADALVGERHFALFPDASIEAVFRETAASRRSYQHRTRPFCPGFSPLRGLARWDWILKPEPEATAGACVLLMHDVSDRLRAEERARMAEVDLRNLISNIPAMIYRTDRDGHLRLLLNSDGLTGYSAAEITALPGHWASLIDPRDRARVAVESRQLVAGSGQLRQTYRIRTRSGASCWVDDHNSPVFGEDGGYLGAEGFVVAAATRCGTASARPTCGAGGR